MLNKKPESAAKSAAISMQIQKGTPNVTASSADTYAPIANV
jgi:hypothetical protein